MAGRLSRENVWYYHMGLNMKGICLCCEKTEIVYNANREDEDYWNRGHIIHKKDSGPDIYENIRPICVKCNRLDKAFESSYHYMASFRKPTMTEKDADREINIIKRLGDQYLENPLMLKCKHLFSKKKSSEKGNRCTNNKAPTSEYCAKHGPNFKELLAEKQRRWIEKGKLADRPVDNDSTDDDFIDNSHLDEAGSSENYSDQDSETSEENDNKKDKDVKSKNTVTKRTITTRSKTTKIKADERVKVLSTSDEFVVPKKEIREMREELASFKRSARSLTVEEKRKLDVIIKRFDQIEDSAQ
jgi:hypothetical protein